MQHRDALFWTVCIPLRAHIALAAKRNPQRGLRLCALVVAYRWLAGLESNEVGVFGGPAWWADARRTHGKLWLAFAIFADWRYLAADTILGALNWWIAGPGKAILPSLDSPQPASDEPPDGLSGPRASGEESHPRGSEPSGQDGTFA